MLYNKTRKMAITAKVRLCRSFLCKASGLMFRKRPDYALIFEFGREQIVPLTMFFVFYPIDVLFLGADKRVVEVKRGFRPFTNYMPKARAKYIIELAEGQGSKAKRGEFLEWQ